MKNKECLKCFEFKPMDMFSAKNSSNNSLSKDKTMDVCKKCRFGIDYKYATKEERLERMKQVFERYVTRNGDYCWDWKGYIGKNGYAGMCFEGKKNGAHRFSWMIHRGDIPKGHFVLHKCDKRECTNPDHLFIGTHQDNMNDMIKKGKLNILKGEDCPWTSLTEKQVIQTVKYLEEGVPSNIIAKKYGVSRSVIYGIKSGRRWNHLDIVRNNNIKKIHRLTSEKVLDVKKAIEDGVSAKDIIEKFDISINTFVRIKRGRNWKHVKI